MSECKATREICEVLRRRNALVFAIVGSTMQEPGWPDRYVAHRKWSGWLEFKMMVGALSTKQRIIIRELTERGVPAYVVRIYDRGRLDIEDHNGNVLCSTDMTRLLDDLGMVTGSNTAAQ